MDKRPPTEEERAARLKASWDRHVRQLFLSTVEDLETRSAIEQVDPYTALGAAALLRKLLIDGGRLVDQVARPYGIRPQFEARPMPAKALWLPPEVPPDEADRLVWMHDGSFDPEVRGPAGAATPRSFNRESLMKVEVLRGGGHTLNVAGLIKHVSVIEGAVHVGEPRDRGERVVFTMLYGFNQPTAPLGFQHMLLRAIGRVVVRGLGPLAAAVEADL